MRMLSERSVEIQKDLYVAYIDYEKAFDGVKHTELFKGLSKYGIDGKDLRIIRNLYWEQLTTIRVGKKHSSWISMKRGVVQGCVLSPDLSSIYGQTIINKIISELGFKVNGTPLFNIRYTDETVIIAEDEDSLKQLLTKLKQESEKMGLNINKKKTEVQVISKRKTMPICNIELDGQQKEKVSQFDYLGSMITSDCKCNKEINRRIREELEGYSKKCFQKT